MHRYEVYVDLLEGEVESYVRTATSEIEARRIAQNEVEKLQTAGKRAQVEILCRLPGRPSGADELIAA